MSFTPTWLPRHVRTRAYHVDNLVPIFVGESGRLAFRIEKAKSSEEEAPEALKSVFSLTGFYACLDGPQAALGIQSQPSGPAQTFWS